MNTTRRSMLGLMMLGSIHANDLRLCGEPVRSGSRGHQGTALRHDPPYLALDLRYFAGLKLIGPRGQTISLKTETIWEELSSRP